MQQYTWLLRERTHKHIIQIKETCGLSLKESVLLMVYKSNEVGALSTDKLYRIVSDMKGYKEVFK